jgi:hypothetical protein
VLTKFSFSKEQTSAIQTHFAILIPKVSLKIINNIIQNDKFYLKKGGLNKLRLVFLVGNTYSYSQTYLMLSEIS